MATFFDPVSVAIETLKTIEGVGSHKPDPIRFKVQLPLDPGTWAKLSAYKRCHDLFKFSVRFQKKINRVVLSRTPSKRLRLQTTLSLPSLQLKPSVHMSITAESLPASQDTTKSLVPAIPDEEEDLEVQEARFDAMYFDYDRRDDEEEEELKRLSYLDRTQLRYLKACQAMHCTPSRRVMRSINTFELMLNTLKLSDLEFKAVMIALIANDDVQRLDVSEAVNSERKMSYLTDIFMEETQITDLIMADNLLQGKDMDRMFDLLTQSDCLVYMDISGNNLTDKDVPMLAEYIKDSSSLAFLYMSRNKFTAAAGDLLGKMIGINTSLVDLDISKNCLRLEGADKFLKGVAKNTGLERLDFSWNGLGKAGVKALVAMIKRNKTLVYINLSGCRLNGKDMEKVLPALKKNTTLERIVLEHNFLVMSDVTVIMTDLYKMKTTGLHRIDFGRYQVIEPNAVPLIDLLFWEKNVDIRYGTVMTHSDNAQKNEDVVTKFRDDPLTLVTRLKPEERMRLVKYFGGLDLEFAIDTGEDIHQESFLNKMRNNRVTFKDLANRIMQVGGNPHDVIRTSLEMSQVTDPDARVVARYSISANVARRLYLKSRLMDDE